MNTNNELVAFIQETSLSDSAKSFLTVLTLSGHEVEIYDSFSELIFSKGFRWIRECDDAGYYAHVLGSIHAGTKIALVRKDLIKDLSHIDDAEQIREMKTKPYEEEQDGMVIAE